MYFIPAGAILTSILIAAIYLPETHGLSIDEIREIYKKRQNSSKLEQGVNESLQEDDEEMPYYYGLRSDLNRELLTAIKQRQSVYVWPLGGAQGIVQLLDNPSNKLKLDNTVNTSRLKSRSTKNKSFAF